LYFLTIKKVSDPALVARLKKWEHKRNCLKGMAVIAKGSLADTTHHSCAPIAFNKEFPVEPTYEIRGKKFSLERFGVKKP